MENYQLRIAHLYGDLMNTYGDYGNVIAKLVFEEDNQQQLENARRTINHIWSRYDKYGREKAYRARSYLYGKGFPVEIIDQVIGEKENDGTRSDFK